MDQRIKILGRKTKWIWIGLVVSAILCLGVFLFFNYTLRDANGPFEKAKMVYELEVPLSRNELTNLEINANDVALEVAMVNNISKIQVGLYGENYGNQEAQVDIQDKACRINYSGKTEDNLTLRVLIPQNDLRKVSIAGNDLDLHLEHMRGDYIDLTSLTGKLILKDLNTNKLMVKTQEASVSVEDSFLTQLDISTGSSPVSLRNNKIRQTTTDSKKGNIFVYGDTWRGQWNLSSNEGNITCITKRLPYSLALDLQSEEGNVSVGYAKRYWKNAHHVANETQRQICSVGNNPSHTVNAKTSTGDISVGQRERFTNIDPLAIQ